MCVVTCIILAVIWFFVGSYLLFFTWNKVVSDITKLGAMKFWQALLVILTILVLCTPRYAYKMHMKKCGVNGGCPISKTAADCPHSKAKIK